MPSVFGWLDTDSEQRARMLEVVELFREAGTVDEMGIGSIRDTIADALFPGTSVLHGRLRYVLFIPWLLQQAAQRGSPEEMTKYFRNLEMRLISSLVEGGESSFVIGIEARSALRRTAAVAHWSALSRWGILTEPTSIDRFFRRQADHRAVARRTPEADDPETRLRLPATGIDPHLPPPPADLLRSVDFSLPPAEEQYLSDRIVTSTEGSLFSWLARHQPGNDPEQLWHLDNLGDAPAHLTELADHARRFHTAIFGAVLLYNLMLAEKSDQNRDVLITEYAAELESWQQELHATRALDGWNRAEWWEALRRHNPRLRALTIRFVNDWLSLIDTHGDVARSDTARDLIRTRERQIKGGRARLANQAALDRWSGSSGLIRLDFRWQIARRHLQDLYAARAAR